MRGSAELAVCVQLDGPLAQEVVSFVEAEAGWHVVDGDGPLRPALVLASQPVPGAVCAVVVAAPAPGPQVRAALLGGALDVIAWPDERARLLTLPQRLRPASARPDAPVLRIGGCRGGAGASTVALAVAGTVAWSGGRALVVGDDGLLRLAGIVGWQGPGARELSRLGAQAADEVGRVARDVPSVPGLSVLGGAASIESTAGWPYDLVVVDHGAAQRDAAQIVVSGADAAVAAAPEGAGVIVALHGPLDRAGVRRRLGRDPLGWLPYSARVARAGSAGRVPSSLPGSWLRALRQALLRDGAAAGVGG